MNKIKVVCDLCGKEYYRSVTRANESIRLNRKQFCSKDCLSKSRNKKIKTSCGYCGKEIFVTEKILNKSLSGKSFCSKSCSCTARNLGRKKTPEERQKISNSLSKKSLDKKCLICGRDFHAAHFRNLCCSRNCSFLYQYGKIPLTKEDLIDFIKQEVLKTGTTPSSKCNKQVLYSANKYWGGWNKMMISLGYSPNTQWMSKKNLKCKDEHRADSISEMIVDNWFFEKGIKHERRKLYPDSKCDCDFYLPDFDVWVEYFGLKGEHKEYDRRIEKKRELAERNKIILIELSNKDLYPQNRISEKFDWVL